VGVGTGYLLDRVGFPSSAPRLALMDLSEACLERTSRKLARHTPEVYVQNLLEPIQHEVARFDSIAVNYVMHCVPGDFSEKHVAFLHLGTLLKQDGVLFGTTVLAQGVKKNLLATPALWLLNAIGLFNNRCDNAQDLEHVLRKHFNVVEFEVVGVVAFFAVKQAPH
jgi:SAM-dependent methyltransferase